MVPPVPADPAPDTVKLPLVLVNVMPLVPPLAAMLVRETANGVVPLLRVISTAVAPVVLTLPLGMVIVLVLSVASSPRWLASGVMVTAPKVTAPVLVVRLIPVLPEEVELVVPKLRVTLEVFTLIPTPVGLVTVVALLVRLPPTLVRLIPVALLFVDTILPNVAVSVPVVKLSA